MSSIAKQLCDEIVEPQYLTEDNPDTDKGYRSAKPSCSRQDARTTRSIIIEKERVVNKLIPQDSDTKKTTIVNKLKSREVILNKKFIDTSINTLFSGPLRCDTNCIPTAKKKSNIACSCKCPKRHCKTSAKQLQAFENRAIYADKACAHYVETTTCGTQFQEYYRGRYNNDNTPRRSYANVQKAFPPFEHSYRKNHANINKIQVPNDNLNEKSYGNITPNDLKNYGNPNKSINPLKSANSKNLKFKNSIIKYNNELENAESTPLLFGARRWALSRYPSKGPDF